MTRTSAAIAALACAAILGTLRADAHATAGTHDSDEEFGPWSSPVNLGPIVNSSVSEAAPAISRDGLSLYFHRVGVPPGVEMFVTRRAAIDLPWEEPISLGPVLNTRLPNAGPTLSRSGHLMFFASVRSGSFDVFVTRRHNVHDDLAWETPVALPATINGPSFDVPSDYFENRDGNPQFYFASDRMTGGGANGLHIYVSEFRPDGTWSDPAFVAELNSPFVDDRPTIRADGLEVIFGSTREGNQDLYVARRRHVRDLWSTPENLGPVLNSPLGDIHPALSANGRTLYFASNRSGSFDLYASTRHRIRGN